MMTGEIIQFVRHPHEDDVYGGQPAPRGTAHGMQHSSVVELQAARIARLLAEPEKLTRASESIRAARLDEIRAELLTARSAVNPWTAGAQCAVGEIEGKPQPDIDDERLEWIYRALNRDS